MISDFPTIWCLIALAWFVINFLDSYHTNHTILLMFHGSINIGLFHVKTKQPWTKILRINPAVQQFVKSVSFPLIQSHRFQLFRELVWRQNIFPNKPIIGINYEKEKTPHLLVYYAPDLEKRKSSSWKLSNDELNCLHIASLEQPAVHWAL